MHPVLANYTLPSVINSLQPAIGAVPGRTSKVKAADAGTGSSTSNSTTGAGLGTTFLNLLSTELQNQDPTAPVDSTAMVGQMISLNQLDQLISINQSLAASGKASGSGVQAPPSVAAGSSLAPLAGAAATLPLAAEKAARQLPFDPNTMMPIAPGNTSAVAASINSSLNAANNGLTSTNSKLSGGK